MLSYLEYKLITSIPFSRNIYELNKNSESSTYSTTYAMAKKLERMGIIKLETMESNGRTISRITPGEAFNAFKSICDNFFNNYYSKATKILEQQIDAIAKEQNLKYTIIGGQQDPTRTYTDIQIAVPLEETAKWKKALKRIESEMNYFGLTTEPSKEKRFLLRRLHVLPMPYKQLTYEIMAAIEDKSMKDIHYGKDYPDLAPYFLYLTIGARNG